MDKCVIVTGFGYAPTYKTFEEWVNEDIQDWDAAFNVAYCMIGAHPDSYPYNDDGGEPEYYQLFDICNLEAFRGQLTAFKELDS